MHTVTLADGRRFPAPAGMSLLDAAAAAGLVLAHGCRTGRCGGCKAHATPGATVALHDEPSLTAAERGAGTILTCARGASADLALDITDTGLPPGLSPRLVPARIDALTPLAEDVLRVTLRLPPGQALPFAAGQYVDVSGPGGLRRSYSMAQPPSQTQRVELQVRRVPGGAMSAWWFTQAKVDDLVRLRGPLGTFFLREVAGADLVFLATGTGIAPVRSMLAQLAAIDHPSRRPASVRVFWGGRTPADLYLDPADGVAPAGARVVPVLSRADAAWTGARGHVQQALLADGFAPGPATRVYACGSPAMVAGARDVLAAAGLDPRRFHADAFVESGAAAKAATTAAVDIPTPDRRAA